MLHKTWFSGFMSLIYTTNLGLSSFLFNFQNWDIFKKLNLVKIFWLKTIAPPRNCEIKTENVFTIFNLWVHINLSLTVLSLTFHLIKYYQIYHLNTNWGNICKISGILGDKTIGDKLMYIPNDNKLFSSVNYNYWFKS